MSPEQMWQDSHLDLAHAPWYAVPADDKENPGVQSARLRAQANSSSYSHPLGLLAGIEGYRE
jgi:polyphosphate kinase 2 (PPK2 family)